MAYVGVVDHVGAVAEAHAGHVLAFLAGCAGGEVGHARGQAAVVRIVT